MTFTAPTGEVQSGSGWWYPQNNLTQSFSDQAGYGYQYVGDPQYAAVLRAAGVPMYSQSAPGVFDPWADTNAPNTPMFTRLPGAPKPAGTPVTTGPAPGTSAADQSAKGIIDTFLANYGLQSLGDQAWQWYLNGQSPDQIMLNVRGTAEYKTRFPAMEQLGKQGHAISEQQYIDYERTIAQQNQAAGLPAGLNDTPDDIKNLLLSNVSPAEHQARLQMYATAAYMSDPQTYQRLLDEGMNPGHATAFFMDPTRAEPLIQRDLLAAQIGGAADVAGYGGFATADAQALAQAGVTQGQAQQGFGVLASQQPLFTPLDAGEQAITQAQQIGATFGNNAQDQAAIAARKQRRLGAFQEGGGFATSNQGFSGAG